MGKRSDFKRRPMDDYDSPPEVVPPLLPHLRGVTRFSEPCVGNFALMNALEKHGLYCAYFGDIGQGQNAMNMSRHHTIGQDAIITNPPWTRAILHPMILHFQSLLPTWLLFDAGWAFTAQAAPFLDQCSHIVAVGRVKWIAGSKYTGKDDCCWYRFHAQHQGGPHFYGKEIGNEPGRTSSAAPDQADGAVRSVARGAGLGNTGAARGGIGGSLPEGGRGEARRDLRDLDELSKVDG